jgi:predicted MFS family arabinose efflux permease
VKVIARSDRPVRFAALFRVAEYRALWSGGLISRIGDQLARVALALLVFHRSGSPFLTALTYALTLLPALLGGPLLGGLADRYPRRGLIVVCNLLRAALGVAMAVPKVPFGMLCVLVFAAQLVDSPERAARTALIRDVLPDDLYPLGVAVNQLTFQVTLLAGLAVGAVIVTAIGPYPALAVNAAAFVCCAAIMLGGVHRRPAVTEGMPSRTTPRAVQSLRLIVGSPRLRTVLALALLAGFSVIPEGLAVPYAAQIGMPAQAVGVLYAAIPAGNVIGILLISRIPRRQTQIRIMGPMAALAGLPLIACFVRPGPFVSVALWTLSGLAIAYQVIAQAECVQALPDPARGQALGLAGSAVTAVQGIGLLAGGVLADQVGPATTIALAGAAGLLTGLPLAMAWHRIDP